MKRGSKALGKGFVYAHDPRMVIDFFITNDKLFVTSWWYFCFLQLLPSVLRFTLTDQRKIIQDLRCHLKIIKAKQGLLYEAAEVREEFLKYYQQQCASYEYDETVDGTHHFHMHNPEKVAPIINEYFSRLNK